MNLDQIQTLVADDMAAVNRLITERLRSDVALVNQVSAYIIHSGGKRLRPVLVLLTAGACGYSGDRHIEAAAIIEFIHTATLLHDDVVDGSNLRRGQDTANHVWGNPASVLVGDFLYSRAFQMMVGVDRMRVMDVLADATNTIAEGEVLQLMHCHDPETTEERYLKVIYCKTAKLFEAGAQIAAILSDCKPSTEDALIAYGRHLGNAFQLIDDTLDYQSDAAIMGKNVGDDLAEGNPTLPLIYALKNGTAQQTETIRHAIVNGGLEDMAAVTNAIESTGAIQYTAALAENEAKHAREALSALPSSQYTEALDSLVDCAVSRTA